MSQRLLHVSGARDTRGNVLNHSRRAAAAILFLCAGVFTVAICGANPRVADAARQRDTAALRKLLQQREDVNAAPGDGATALHWAAQWNDMEAANMPIRARANTARTNGQTPYPITQGLYLAGSFTVNGADIKAVADAKAAIAAGRGK